MEARSIRHAWVSTDGSTGACNYDEFAGAREIVAALRERPDSMLSIDLPQYEPAFASARGDLTALLARASERLESMKRRGRLRPWEDVVVVYEIMGAEGRQLAATVMLPTGAVWDAARNPAGWIIPSERVFRDKIGDCLAHLRALRHFVSSVLLLTADADGSYTRLLQDAIDTLRPQAEDLDQRGSRHRVWPIPPSDLQRRLLARLSRGELVVADGNHRCMAARESGFDQFLGAVVAAETMHILSYNRLVTSLGMDQAAFMDRLHRAGFTVVSGPDRLAIPGEPGHLAVRLRGRSLQLTPPPALGQDPVSRLDQWVVESLIFERVLNMSAADPRIRYVGGDRDPVQLQALVDGGACECAIAVAPVGVGDFMEVNRQRLQMPPKSTWFRPKIRVGLVVAEADDPAGSSNPSTQSRLTTVEAP